MPRRALRKIDHTLDYSRHFCIPSELPAPWDAAAVFPANPAAPLEVEVGSGKGQFIQEIAHAHPDRNFLGVEVARTYAAFCAARLIRAELTNAVMVNGDAMEVFRERMPDSSLAAVHVYFPDPWWKKRHRKRRIMRMEFVREVERTLMPGGKLHFWTDVQEYFDTTAEMMAAESVLRGPFTPEVAEDAWRTHFEKRTLLEDRPVWRAFYVKQEK